MALDKAAISENAQLLTSRGQFDKAIAEWKKLATGTPADGNIYNTIGDLHLKRNAPADAIEAYLQAAAAFRAADAAIKAAALYKKILKIDPNRTQAYQHLGDLNAGRGLVTDAVADYLALGKLYLKAGKRQEALGAYRAAAKLDAANAEARQRIAELDPAGETAGGDVSARTEGKSSVGSPAGEPAGPSGMKLSSGAGRAETSGTSSPSEAASIPGEAKGSREWTRQDWLDEAHKQTAAGRFTEAESVLMELLSKEPGDPEVCRLLASLHLKRGELSGAKAEFRFLAEAALRAMDFQLAESMLCEYLGAEADCVELVELLGRVYEQSGKADKAVVQYGNAIELLIRQPDPEQPMLPSELYAKIVELAPGSPLVGRHAARFKPGSPAQEPVRPAAPPAPAKPAVESKQTAPVPAAPPVSPSAPSFKFASSEQAPETEEPVGAAAAAAGAESDTPAARNDAPIQAEAPEEAAPGPEGLEAGPEKAEAPSGWEQPVEPDYGAHYELGVAYRNMSLQDEAIEEFQLATGSSEYFLDACRMLAACLTDRGMNRPAIEYLGQALADPRCKGAEADVIRYELGLLYEAEGMEGSALQIYSQIPSFRDVPRRLERITGSSEPVPSAVGGPADESPVPERKKRRISYL